MQHILQPKHIKLSDGDAVKVLQKFNITVQQLPRIKQKDAALQELDVKKGDVIKIDRKDLVGEYDYYRVVI